MADNNETFLRAMLSLMGRLTFPPEKLAGIVIAKGAGTKQAKAFNLCDGSKSQGEIAKTLGLDTGNFSRTVSRWLADGIVFRIGEGRDAKLLHVYPLPGDVTKKGGTK